MSEDDGAIIVTGTRIKSAGLSSTSPISTLEGEQIQLLRAVTIEDISVKIPQLAGGVNSTSVGSDAFGAQTLDLRNLGQNRTLVLINGTRALPFSFRNAVDVNSIPAPLLKRVDVLTGGAAAVYGADAVAGVVNFIINDDFDGLQGNINYRAVAGGGSQKSGHLLGGMKLGDRGSIVGYVEYTDRDPLLAGNRRFARKGAATLPIGAYEPRWFMRDMHMNPDDAVKALADCGADIALAHHHGTFQLTDEAIDAPVKALADALDAAKVPRDRFLALQPGQVFEI